MGVRETKDKGWEKRREEGREIMGKDEKEGERCNSNRRE